jgi:hypothetical protein
MDDKAARVLAWISTRLRSFSSAWSLVNFVISSFLLLLVVVDLASFGTGRNSCYCLSLMLVPTDLPVLRVVSCLTFDSMVGYHVTTSTVANAISSTPHDGAPVGVILALY